MMNIGRNDLNTLYTLLILAGVAALFSITLWAIICCFGAVMNAMRGVNLRGEHWYLNMFPWLLGFASKNKSPIPHSSLISLGCIFIFFYGILLIMYWFN